MKDDLVALGYLMVRPMRRDSFFSAELVPELIVSASACLCHQFPGDYAVDWCSVTDEERTRKLGEFGIDPTQQAAARKWATENFDDLFGWPGTFYSLRAAIEARTTLIPAATDVRVLGIGLPETKLDDFLRYAAPPPPTEGYSPQGETGSFTMAKRRERLVAGGRVLGFEMLNLEFGHASHTWLCNQLETHCANVLGIRPNADGFIGTFEDAQRCCDEISHDEVGSEPGPWLPFALVEYEGPRREHIEVGLRAPSS
jgi:hypothetical protein